MGAPFDLGCTLVTGNQHCAQASQRRQWNRGGELVALVRSRRYCGITRRVAFGMQRARRRSMPARARAALQSRWASTSAALSEATAPGCPVLWAAEPVSESCRSASPWVLSRQCAPSASGRRTRPQSATVTLKAPTPAAPGDTSHASSPRPSLHKTRCACAIRAVAAPLTPRSRQSSARPSHMTSTARGTHQTRHLLRSWLLCSLSVPTRTAQMRKRSRVP